MSSSLPARATNAGAARPEEGLTLLLLLQGDAKILEHSGRSDLGNDRQGLARLWLLQLLLLQLLDSSPRWRCSCIVLGSCAKCWNYSGPIQRVAATIN